jgi:hypothetical protein
MSQLKVNALVSYSGNTVTLGASGDTITVASGVTFNTATAVVLAAGAVGTPSLTTSGDTNTGIFFPAADTIAFTEGGTEAMRLNSNGQVGISQSSPNQLLCIGSETSSTGSPTYKGFIRLGSHSSQSLNTDGGIEFVSTSFTNGYGWRLCCPDLAGSNVPMVFESRDNDATWTERMRITLTGSLILAGSTAQKATGTTWSNPSDTRLKDNKQNYTKGLQELLQINVKTWEWNGKAGTTQGDVGIGVIADEIETILPNTIDTYKAKLNEDDIEETDVKRFDATEITWLLLNSIKEQQAIIEELKARLTVLENN